MNRDGREWTRASTEVSVTCRDALTWTVADDAGVTRNEKVIGSIPIGGSSKSPGRPPFRGVGLGFSSLTSEPSSKPMGFIRAHSAAVLGFLRTGWWSRCK